MTPEPAAAALLAARTVPIRLVVFDCDGVLIDSEPIASRVVAGALTRLGWPMTAEESHATFLGMSLSDMRPLIERRTGRPLPVEWVMGLASDLVAAMAREAALMPGAREAMDGVTSLGLDWRVASNSGRDELAAKFARVGWTHGVAGRVHSAADLIAQGGRGKPAPDVYLAAAAASGIDPAACLVIEDSATGVAAAEAAGMDCLAFGARAPISRAAPLNDLAALPALLAATRLRRAA